MAKKCVVKVVLSKEQREILSELSRRLGTSESEMLRTAFMDYAKELSMVKERLHRKTGGQPHKKVNFTSKNKQKIKTELESI
ncbi:MAG: ribbon-helix-helix protein, CopG family [Candidatus Bathyarchaeia archaeon]|jgi:hypothetical protein